MIELLHDALGLLLVIVGALFFAAGTLALIRFPGVRNRLHALTKADNLGLGLIMLGSGLLLGSWTAAGVLLLAWLLGLGAASVSAHVLAENEVRQLETDTDDLDAGPASDAGTDAGPSARGTTGRQS